eukprot:gene5064-6459_t
MFRAVPTAGGPAMTAFHVEILSACTVLLASVSLALLWRCRRLERALEAARACGAVLLHEERLRIASDIHDDLGQNLLTLGIELAALQNHPGLPRSARPHLATLLAHTDAAV